MIINDAAGSGGDMLPYMFRLKKIGPLVGTRTWGGLVGIWDVPALVDGGYITAPRGGFYNLNGEWDIENEGVDRILRLSRNQNWSIRDMILNLKKRLKLRWNYSKRKK
jgi:tricorn protease